MLNLLSVFDFSPVGRAPYECYSGSRLGYYNCFVLARLILFIPCLMCDRLDVIYKFFAYVNTLYVSVWSETGH